MQNEQYKQDLIERRGWMCEYCHVRPATDLHHALIGRMKGHPELDVEENLMCACSSCHVEKVYLDTQEVKTWFWGVQCERYGHDHMVKWIKSLPLKVKPKLYQ
jgi:hypothetical protein